MPKRLLPRPPTEMGKRGQILAVFGLTWIGMGYALLMDGDPVAWARLEPFEWVPATLRGWAWIATGWAVATTADPSVKANAVAVTTPAATAAGNVTHAAIFSAPSGGTQRTDWTLLTDSKTVGIGDTLSLPVGSVRVTLT